MQKHTIPVHLETEDTLVYGLTTKQVMVLAAGLILAYALWSSFPSSLLGLAISLVLAAIPAILALLVAFVRPAGQGMDEWIMVWFFFLAAPKTYLWEPYTSDLETVVVEPRPETVVQEEDE